MRLLSNFQMLWSSAALQNLQFEELWGKIPSHYSIKIFIFHTLCDDRMWHFGSIWELLKCFWLICLSSCCYSIGRKLYLISSWINEKTPTLTRCLLACNPEEKILLLGCHIAYAYVLKDKQGHNMKKPSLLLEKLGLTIKEMNGG